MRSRGAFLLTLMTTTAAALSPDLAPAYARALGQASGIDGAVAVTLGKEGIGTPAQRLGEAEGNPIRHAAGVVVDTEIDEGCSQ